MIEIRVIRDGAGQALGFESRGHAEYADEGYDIICAAVSVLELNLANSVSGLTCADFKCEADDEAGAFSFRLADAENRDARLLLDSCLLGLKSVQAEYGERYIQMIDQEV